VLSVDPGAVDLHRFRDLLTEAGNASGEAPVADLLDQALRLWRDPAFGALDTPWLNTVRAALNRERHAAQLHLIDLRLSRGDHAAVLTRLAELAEECPLDERVAGQYMVALSRNGQPAQALAHHERLRGLLADELGTDVGPELRRLHEQILTETLPPAPGPSDNRAAAGPPCVVPRQLPVAPVLFTGRAAPLADLDRMLDPRTVPGGVPIVAIGGPAGVGKTWLALHWAHLHAEHFPDGQLYVNLRGFDASGEPVAAGAVVRGFLDALGADPATIPVDPDAQAALYRSMVAGRRILVVLDNAASAAQVVPLLPGSPPGAVVVTSRHQLTGLVAAYGAYSVELDPLSSSEARELLVRRLGRHRVEAEDGAATELLEFCAGLPLALGIVAARVASHPSFPLATLAAELVEESTRLAVLDVEDPGVSIRAVFSWSCRALEADTGRVFGLVGLLPGDDAGVPAITALAGLPADRTRAVLRELETAYLIQQYVPGRYRMHDLTRLYAAGLAAHDQPAADQLAALRRLTDHYLHTAIAGHTLLYPTSSLIRPEPPVAGSEPRPLADKGAALAWFAAEHSCLLAVQRMVIERGWPVVAWELAWTLDTFHRLRGLLADHVATWERAVQAARRVEDPYVQASARRLLGTALARAGRHPEALEQLERALELAEAAGDPVSLAHTHRALAVAWGRRDDYRRAVDHASRALPTYQDMGNPVWESDTLNMAGWYAAQLGCHQQAREHCTAALTVARQSRSAGCEANALDSLGYIAHHTGQHTAALDYYQQALVRWRDTGDAYEQADTLDRLGSSHAALGQRHGARHSWRQALALYEAQKRDTDVARVRTRLATLDPCGVSA
jgi:Tfp pilus assembly protein PilF